MNIRKLTLLLTATLLVTSASLSAQAPSHARWDELTASDWPKALERSNRTCILPIGILEKHGPHAPIGSDLIKEK
ncbi:MAG TPA: creatininase family protein [Puia sp.]|nr:creatininase family protein [Puia sp.]